MTQPHHSPESDLPPELIAAIAVDVWAALAHETDDGRAILICKAPGFEIANWHGPLRISTAIELYRLSSAPLVRMLSGLYEDSQAGTPTVLFGSFLNVADADRRSCSCASVTSITCLGS